MRDKDTTCIGENVKALEVQTAEGLDILVAVGTCTQDPEELGYDRNFHYIWNATCCSHQR